MYMNKYVYFPAPQGRHALGSGEFRLLITSTGLELRPVDPTSSPAGLVLGWHRSPLSQCLIGWQDLSDNLLGLAFLIWQPEQSKHKSMHAVWTVPKGMAKAITAAWPHRVTEYSTIEEASTNHICILVVGI